MAYSRTSFTVKTNGQTLAIDADDPGGSAALLHLTTAVSSAVTLPYTITSDTTFYVADELAGDYVLSAKQPDGSELYGKAIKLRPGRTVVVEPVPSALQAGADLSAPNIASLYTTSGEGTYDRMLCTASVAGITGVMRFTFFTARRTEQVTKVAAWVGETAAAATPTLCRFGVYTVTAAGAGTLVASTANDTALFATIRVKSEKALSAPYAKVAGQRYAIGALVVSAGTCPTLLCSAHETGIGAGSRPLMGTAPRLAGYIGSLTDLPASFVNGDLTNNGAAPYYELT